MYNSGYNSGYANGKNCTLTVYGSTAGSGGLGYGSIECQSSHKWSILYVNTVSGSVEVNVGGTVKAVSAGNSFNISNKYFTVGVTKHSSLSWSGSYATITLS